MKAVHHNREKDNLFTIQPVILICQKDHRQSECMPRDNQSLFSVFRSLRSNSGDSKTLGILWIPGFWGLFQGFWRYLGIPGFSGIQDSVDSKILRF